MLHWVSPMGCLDDSTIYQFAMGGLERDALDTADAHIDACDDCRMIVVGLVRSGATADSGFDRTELGHPHTSTSNHAEDWGHTLTRGQVLGEKYVVLDVLGAGAMGIVYAAWDSSLERKVAIKTLRADASFRDRKERFVREAQAMAKIAHPNVVAVHDVGEVGELAYIAMEFVEGGTLREWSTQTERSWQARRDMCVQAGRGLVAAHAAGLVHRDFKPENVLVGADGRARVTDFGLVALAGNSVAVEAPPTLVELTVTGAVMGTPAYMAPEQFRAEIVDSRTDQYAFCATTWEVLFGTRPIAAKSFDEQLKKVLDGKLPPPPNSAPTWLSQALLRGLAVEQTQRHSSMEELLEAMVRDRRASPGKRIGIGVAVAGLGIAAALIAGRGQAAAATPCEGAEDAIASVWNQERSAALKAQFGVVDGTAVEDLSRDVEAWKGQWVSAHTATCQATHVRGEQSPKLLDARMQCLQHRANETDALLTEIEGGEATALTAGLVGLAEMPAVSRCAAVDFTASMAPSATEALREPLTKARALVATGQYEEAKDGLGDLVARATKLAYAPLLAEAQLLLARATWKAGRADLASPIALDAVLAAVAGGADADAAEAWISLMGMAGEQGKYELAMERSRHARAALQRLGDPPELQSRFDHGLGVLLYNQGKYDASLLPLERAMKQRVAEFGENHTLVASSHTSLGNAHRGRASFDVALKHHQSALAIDRRILGDAHPNIGRHEHNIAGVYRLQGHLDKAREHYLKALEIKTLALGAQHVDVGLTKNSLGLLALADKNYTEAEAYFMSAESILGAAAHADRAVSAHNRGLVASAQGNAKLALKHYSRAALAYAPEQRELREVLATQIAEAQASLQSKPREARSRAAEDSSVKPELGEGVYAPSQTWE